MTKPASIKIDPSWNPGAIGLACAAAVARGVVVGQDGNTLYADVPQDVLDRVAAKFDHAADARNVSLARIRAERDRRLDESDWMVLRALDQNATLDYLASPDHAYREALRTLLVAVASELSTKTSVSEIRTYNPSWPEKPK